MITNTPKIILTWRVSSNLLHSQVLKILQELNGQIQIHQLGAKINKYCKDYSQVQEVVPKPIQDYVNKC